MIDIKVYHVSEIMTNCSYLVDKATGKSAVVDPGGKSQKLIEQIKSDGGNLEYVMLTHGHYDHIEGAPDMIEVDDYIYVPGIRSILDGDLSDIKAYVIKGGKAQEISLYIQDMTQNEREIVKAGCLINFNRNRKAK